MSQWNGLKLSMTSLLYREIRLNFFDFRKPLSRMFRSDLSPRRSFSSLPCSCNLRVKRMAEQSSLRLGAYFFLSHSKSLCLYIFPFICSLAWCMSLGIYFRVRWQYNKPCSTLCTVRKELSSLGFSTGFLSSTGTSEAALLLLLLSLLK